MRSILVILSTGLVSAAPQFGNSGQGCNCNGHLNSNGQGECRSKYQGRVFCYVDPGRCSDEVASSTEGQWWSHNACQTKISSLNSEFSPTDESKVNFGNQVEEKKEESQKKQCICNGLRNSRGEGECKSSYKGQAFCYVDKGSCSDEAKSTSSDRWWSYQACSATQQKFFSQGSTSNAIGNVVGGIIEEKLKLIGGVTNAIGGIINDVFTQGNPASEAIDRQEGENECWCVGVTERGRKGSSRIQNRIVNRPLCGVGETMVCRDEEEEEEVDTAPLMKQDNECSCNGKLNNERLGVQPCESSFRGSAWCYVQPGFCADEITSDTTGKSWSQDACGVQHSANNKEKSNGVNPIVPRLQLQLE